MMVEAILREAVELGSSDIYIISGKPVTFKVNGKLASRDGEILTPPHIETLLREIYRMANERDFSLLAGGDDDFAVAVPGLSRFRVNAYSQRMSLASVIRTIPDFIPEPKTMNIPDSVMELTNYTRGILLFTGTTGSGKSTTMACLIDKINKTRHNHIITIEDPIEYLHSHGKSIISQRELKSDTESFPKALRAAMRQAPDVILLGEMRDHETISAAITAAETGHLVISTLHTIGAGATVDRIIDVFPANQQNQIRTQLSITLQAVVSQQLIPSVSGKLAPAFEIMIVNNAIRNLIRENKVFQIENIIQTSAAAGMKTMDMSILELCRARVISRENALLYSVNRQAAASITGGPLL